MGTDSSGQEEVMSDNPRPSRAADHDPPAPGPVETRRSPRNEPDRQVSGVGIGAGEPNSFEPEEATPGNDARER